MSGRDALAFDFSKAGVLMIDASPVCLEVLSAILRGFGFRRLYRCPDPKAAVEVLQRVSVDLLFMDPFPFGKAGYSLVKRLRGQKASTVAALPILFMSANPQVRVVSAAQECGADYVIAKPFSSKTIFERILWVMESEGRRGELNAPKELVSAAGSGVDLW